MSYTRMALVHPTLVEAPTMATPQVTPPSASEKYFESQLTRQRLEPQAGLLEVLTKLHRTMVETLGDEALSTREKLERYNRMLYSSKVLMSKSGETARRPVVSKPLQPTAPNDFGVSEEVSDDYDPREDVDEYNADPTPVEKATTPPTQVARVRTDDADADTSGSSYGHSEFDNLQTRLNREIPVSYRRDANKLYKLIAQRTRNNPINWNTDGKVTLGGVRIPGGDIVSLIGALVKRPALSKKRAATQPKGLAEFRRALVRINPSLRYVRDKAPHRHRRVTHAATSEVLKPPDTPKQIGHGSSRRRVFKWATHL